MYRPRLEVMSKTLKRLTTTIDKKLMIKSPNKKKSNKTKVILSNIADNILTSDLGLNNVENNGIIVKYSDESIVEVNILKNEEISSGMHFTHNFFTFEFIRNPPIIIALQLYPKSYVMIDYPIVPTVTTKFAHGFYCEWFCESKNKEVVRVSNDFFYIPGPDTLGCKLKMICTPWRWAANMKKENDNAKSHEIGNFCVREKYFNKKNNENREECSSANSENEYDDKNRITGRSAVCYVSSIVQPAALGSKILEVRKEFNKMEKEKREGNSRDNKNNICNDNHIRGDIIDCNNNDITPILSSSDTHTSNVNLLPFSKLSLSDDRDEENINDANSPCAPESKGGEDDIPKKCTIYREFCELRVVTFNILAEPFAISNHAINKIYSYCDASFLQTEYRVQLVFKELIEYDADIISLQECDYKTFQLYLQPLLSSYGYDLHFTNKVRTIYILLIKYVRFIKYAQSERSQVFFFVSLSLIVFFLFATSSFFI